MSRVDDDDVVGWERREGMELAMLLHPFGVSWHGTRLSDCYGIRNEADGASYRLKRNHSGDQCCMRNRDSLCDICCTIQ